MKLVNKTKWATEDLEAFVEAASRELNFNFANVYNLVFAPAKKWVSARVMGLPGTKKTMTIKLPNRTLSCTTHILTLGQLFHWMKNFHMNMPRQFLKGWQKEEVPWAEKLRIRRDEEVHPPPTRKEHLDVLRSKRRKESIAHLAKLEARLVRLKRLVEHTEKRIVKAQKRVKYYMSFDLECDLISRIQEKLTKT